MYFLNYSDRFNGTYLQEGVLERERKCSNRMVPEMKGIVPQGKGMVPQGKGTILAREGVRYD